MLGLAFHELTMNAVRFGALSVAGGRVSVDWHRDGDEVRICWREDGGPAVEPPSRSGFGRLLARAPGRRVARRQRLARVPPERPGLPVFPTGLIAA